MTAGSVAFAVVTADPASASVPSSSTFTSAGIGSSGQTPQFSESGNWQMAWNYDCSAFGSQGNFVVMVNQPNSSTGIDVAPNELGMSGSGTDSYTDTGTFSLSVNSECTWSITVSPSASAPLGGGATFTSAGIGSSGQTPQFSESGNWQMAWNYDCSAFGSQGNFVVMVNQPNSSTGIDVAPNELGMSGSGTDSYTDTGTFSLSVNSECTWSITVSPNGAGAGTPPVVPPTTVGATCSEALPSGSVVDTAAIPSGTGYWEVSRAGQVAACGSAPNLGGLTSAPTSPIVGMAATSNGQGYWLVGANGGVYTFGNAVFYGSMGAVHLNQPVVGMAVDPATGGYWLVASDGGIFSFNAPFYGSTGAIHLNQPIVGMEATSNGGGYRFVAADGGVFDFGNAVFYGSAV
jgi:hypothetical protein